MAFYLRPYEDLRNGEVQVNAWSWTSLGVGFFALLPGGSLYCFALFGPVFHTDFHLSALQLNLLSAFGWLGAAVASFPGGILVDAWGPVIPLGVSAVMSFLGYFLLYMLLRHELAYNFGGLLMSYFVVGIGVQLTTIAIMSCNLKNFPSWMRGKVLGIMGLSIALASAFYGTFFRIFFRGHSEGFLLFLAIINCFLCLVGGVATSVPKEKSYSKHWKKLLLDALGSPKQENQEGILRGSSEDDVWRPRQVLGDVKFWLIFAIGFFGTSLGLMFLSVLLGSVYTSHGGPQGGQAWAVIFGGISNAIGRLGGGAVTDATLHMFKRSMWAFPCYALMAIGIVLMMTVQSFDVVTASSILIGLGYGGLAGGIFPSVVADVFGTKHYAKNFSLLQPAYPLGFLVWGQVAGVLYENQVTEGSSLCVGFHCFQNVFIFMLVILGLAVGATLSLTLILPSTANPVRPKPPQASDFVRLNDQDNEMEVR